VWYKVPHITTGTYSEVFFKNRMQERISGPNKEQVSGGLRNLLNRKLNSV
jgi:hypothetical protein